MQAFFILIVLILVTGLIPNKKLGCLLLFLYLWFLFAYSYGNADYFNYKLQYQLYGQNLAFDEIQNIGYKFICWISNRLGIINYQSFLIIEATIILIITFFAIIKFSDKPWNVTILYIIYTFPIDTVQVRFFLGRTIVLLGILIFLSVKDNFAKYIALATFIIWGALVHVSLFAYLIFLFIPYLNRNYIKFWIVGTILFQVVVFLNFRTIALLVTSDSSINEYLSKSVSVYYIIFIVSYMFVNYIISYLCYRFSLSTEYVNSKNSNFIDVAFRINTLLFIFAPMACITSDFLRLFRITFFLNYIAVFNVNQRTYDNRDWTVPINAISLCKFGVVLLTILSNYMFISSSYMDTVVIPLFEYNLLLP